MLNVETLGLVTVTFIVGGIIKGAVGLGLPIVALVFMAVPLGMKPAIAIMLVPGVFTNIWQAFAGPALTVLTRRLRSFLLLSVIGIFAGVSVLSKASPELLLSLLGVILALYSLISLLSPQIRPPGRFEPVLSPLAGGLGGILYGMTGTFMVPGVVYLQALGLKKDELVQALGIVFITINICLIGAFFEKGFIDRDISILSFYALVPTWIGLQFGQRLRGRISEALFRTIFFGALLLVGMYFITVGWS